MSSFQKNILVEYIFHIHGEYVKFVYFNQIGFQDTGSLFDYVQISRKGHSSGDIHRPAQN